jgi:hypothetical protein
LVVFGGAVIAMVLAGILLARHFENAPSAGAAKAELARSS